MPMPDDEQQNPVSGPRNNKQRKLVEDRAELMGRPPIDVRDAGQWRIVSALPLGDAVHHLLACEAAGGVLALGLLTDGRTATQTLAFVPSARIIRRVVGTESKTEIVSR